MTDFLLDVHLPLDILPAFRLLAPEARVEHVARWRDGSLRTAVDEEVLVAAAEAGLVFVTHDVRTVRSLADHWVILGSPFPAVIFIVGTTTAPNIGGIARGSLGVHCGQVRIDPAYPIVYLQVP